ncbi:MAG: PD40 domain-containing protein [Flavobacteriia bacterium]|nr:PD40 domain-containing protein [Flavobacteriia bacterium]
MRILLSLSFLILCQCSVQAQSRRARDYFTDAQQNIRNRDYEEAMDDLESALRSSPDYAEAWLLKADLHMMLREGAKAIQSYRKAYDNSGNAAVLFRWGAATLEYGQYAVADSVLTAYVNSSQANPRYVSQANDLRARAAWAADKVNNPVDFDPQYMGEHVNKLHMQYFPAITADGNTLMFTARNLDELPSDEDFYFTRRDSLGNWSEAQPLPGRLNTAGNEGAMCLSADGEYIFYTGCDREGGFGSCDIYISFREEDGTYSEGRNLGEAINTRYWESQPALSPDGKTLFFVRGSNSRGGTMDIYYSNFTEEGWTQAKKVEGDVNTPAKEESPFIHFDGRTMYFASEGHLGMGQSDLFMATLQPDGTWGDVKNLGYPINTYKGEIALVVAPDGKTAFYSSDRGRMEDRQHLYMFELPEEVRATPVAWISGVVVDDETNQPIQAKLEFVDLSTGNVILSDVSNRRGQFQVSLPSHSSYALNVNGKGYMFYSENFALEGQSEATAEELMVRLRKLKVGDAAVLSNIFYEYDSYELTEKSTTELEKLVQFLNENPTVRLSIDGHTDNIGGATYNKELSKQRAQSIVDYLIANGIDEGRLESRGYGDTRPIEDNSTEEGRARNRRTELTILNL